MSKNYWHVIGHGFDLQNVTKDNYDSFMRNHMETLKRVYDGWKDTSILLYHEGQSNKGYFGAVRYKYNSLSEPVAAVISEETSIRCQAPGVTEDGEDCVIFVPEYPWRFNMKEKWLNYNDLEYNMSIYAEELGVDFTPNIDLVYQK